jgi:hypothetical protein
VINKINMKKMKQNTKENIATIMIVIILITSLMLCYIHTAFILLLFLIPIIGSIITGVGRGGNINY